MTEFAQRALLPAGLRDMLPPEAEFEARVVERLMATLAAHGYERVKPPLVEFEDSLLADSGASMATHTFRLMDPVSQRMMGLRADMTLQVARVAATRLKALPRPLRLSYAGQVLRVKGDDLRPERQFGQVGAELIGCDAAAADAEAVLLAASALTQRRRGQPQHRPVVAEARAGGARSAWYRRRRRSGCAMRSTARTAPRSARWPALRRPFLAGLLAATGPADKALAAIARLSLPGDAAAEVARLVDVVKRVKAALPALQLTVDPVEMRGFEYHTGLCFTRVRARRARRAGARRALHGGRCLCSDGRRAVDRLHAVYRHRAPRAAGTRRRDAALCSVRRRPCGCLRGCRAKAGSPWQG